MATAELRLQHHIKPGPKYMLRSTVGYNDHDPTLKRSPAYSLGFRFTPPNEPKQSCIPPPIKYNCNGMVRNGPLKVKGGALSFRTGKPIQYGPSAMSYSPDYKKQSTFKSIPSCILGNRPKAMRFTGTPASNNYVIPHSIGKNVAHLKTAPAYSVLGRWKKMPASSTPHALSYPAVNCDIYKRKPPEYSVKGRFLDRNIYCGSKTPAPNAYFPHMVHLKNQPSFLFGVKGKSSIPKSLMDDGQEDIHVESHELEPF